MPKAKKDELDLELIDRTDIEIERTDPPEDEDENIPQYKKKIDLTDEQIIRLRKEVFDHFEALKQQRSPMEKKWDNLDAQYAGEMENNTQSEFALDVPVTPTKIDILVSMGLKAFLKSDPVYAVTSRPGTIRKGQDMVAEHQEDYLDYLFDEEISLEDELRPTLDCSALKGVGFLKIPYHYQQKAKKREEHYSGKDPENEIKRLLQNYPHAMDPTSKDHWIVKKLIDRKDVHFAAEFNETVYNNPKPSHVAITDFWADKDISNYDELCDAQITIEAQHYTWWELKKMEKDGDLENVDEMKYSPGKDPGENSSLITDYKTRKQDIIEVVYCFNEKEESDNPDDEIRIVCWFGVESKAYLGAINYPYYGVECYYIPFHCKKRKKGLWKSGVGETLTSSHLAQNALLNFTLTGAWIQNTVTPIVKEGSPVAAQFLEDRFTHGVPIEVKADVGGIAEELNFLDKPNVHSGELINLLMFLAKYDDDRTRISPGTSGKESPTDPNAPAAKTLALLELSKEAIGDYIDAWAPSFNKIGEISLQLIYQMSREGRKYRHRMRAGAVTGADPFLMISRDEMVAKTNIQTQAMTFAFDKLREKQENLALFQTIGAHVSTKPQAFWELVRTLIKSWSPTWKNKVDQVWPSPEEFNRQQIGTAVQGLQLYLQQIQQQRKLTGAEPQVNMQDFLGLMTQLQAAQMQPPQEEKK